MPSSMRFSISAFAAIMNRAPGMPLPLTSAMRKPSVRSSMRKKSKKSPPTSFAASMLA